jgi:CHAT domain-containing protein/tetratricopeptide (TPR) repeat protein
MPVVAWLMPFVATSQPAPLILTNPGAPIHRSLEGAAPDVVLLPLTAGQYARVEVLQTGSDVVVNLFDPDGGKLARIDSPNDNLGPEPVSLVAATSGSYRVEVTLGAPKPGHGAYDVALLEKRAALPADYELVSGEREFFEAQDLQNRRTADSRQAAIAKYTHALDVFQRAGRTYQQGLTANTMGSMAAQAGSLPQALEFFQQAAGLFERAPDPHMLLSVLINIGGMQDLLGQPQSAFQTYEKALAIARAQNESAFQGTLLSNIGKLRYDTGEWQQAIGHYRQALEIDRAAGDTGRQGYVLHNMATAYAALGELDQALEFSGQALDLRRAAGDRRGEADTLRGLANIHRDLNHTAEAIENYQLSLAVRRALGDRRGEADTLASLGIMQSRLSQTDAATATLAKSLELAKAAGDRRTEAYAMNCLAENSLRAGKAPDAAGWASRSLAVYREIESRTGAELALEQLARAEDEQGNPDAARRHMEEALELIELTRTRTDNQQLRASFFAKRQDAYAFYIGLLMRAYSSTPSPALLAKAFETSERARARSLIEMLAESGADPRGDANPELLRRQREIAQLLNAKGSRLLATASVNSPAAVALRKEIGSLELEASEVEAAVRKSSPRYAALIQPAGLSTEEIRRDLLDADTVLLEFTLAEPQSYLWIADSNGLSYRELPSRAVVELAARQTMQFVTARQDAAAADSARQLSQLLFGSSLPAQPGKRLAIVPDGALQTVPMAMLPIPGTGEPLVTSHEVVMLPSLAALAALRQEVARRTPAPKTVAVFADPAFQTAVSAGGETRILEHLADLPADQTTATRLSIPRLPYTLREADEILRAASPASASWRAVGVNASREAALNGQLAQYRFIHFATHGYLDTERPSLSALLLSQVDEKNRPVDGFLRVNDIYNTRLNADLVVLSACQTGLGKEVRGEGIMGLTRAFMYAGAARVVVSLWNVNDRATAALMGSFYRKMLRQGMRPAAALRQAQLELRQNKPWASPYYWAAFQLQGDWK